MPDIAYHYPYLAGLPGATDYPVHFVAGQNTVPTIGLVAMLEENYVQMKQKSKRRKSST